MEILAEGHDDIFYDDETVFLSKTLLGYKPSTAITHTKQVRLKVEDITSAKNDNDLDRLKQLGMTKEGFSNHKLRRKCWNLILKLGPDFNDKIHWNEEICCELIDETQIKLDVKRSFGFIKKIELRNEYRKILNELIIRFFKKYPTLRYYQGYHDIVSIFILVYYENDRTDIKTLFYCLEVFTLLYLRDFMMNSLDFTIDQLKLIPIILKKLDSEFVIKLKIDEIDPFYAISSILTIFSHDELNDQMDINSIVFQIFDLVISAGSMLIPLIIYSFLIIENKSQILAEYNLNLKNFENVNDLTHAIIQKILLKNRPNLEIWNNALDRSRIYYECDSLKPLDNINDYSTLKRQSICSFDELITITNLEIESDKQRYLFKSKKSLFFQPCTKLLWKWSVGIGILTILLRLYYDKPINLNYNLRYFYDTNVQIYIRSWKKLILPFD